MANISNNIHQISTHTVKPASQSEEPYPQPLDLTPWDLMNLPNLYIQRGLLFNKPKEASITILDRLRKSLSHTLDYFLPLTGRIAIKKHEADNTMSFYIDFNAAGVQFIQAKAEITMADVLGPVCVPEIVHAMFPLNGVVSYDGISKPLFVVQVTELFDGIFIGCSMNHVVCDGCSFWHFMNSWSEISKAMPLDCTPSRLPVSNRWFYEQTHIPIRFPVSVVDTFVNREIFPRPVLHQRIFHFTPQKIAQLKVQANAEMEAHHTISSLQALLAHVWKSVTRARCLDPNQVVINILMIDNRSRLIPPLPLEYFGNCIGGVVGAAQAGELLERSLGWAASLLNQAIRSYTEAEVRSYWASWVKNPTIFIPPRDVIPTALVVGDSPRFDMYSNDFGWGKPVTVRCGCQTTVDGHILVRPGAVEGSIDVELSLSPEVLKDIGEKIEFTELVN